MIVQLAHALSSALECTDFFDVYDEEDLKKREGSLLPVFVRITLWKVQYYVLAWFACPFNLHFCPQIKSSADRL